MTQLRGVRDQDSMSENPGTVITGPTAVPLVKRPKILPYGDTLHHKVCGCPNGWTRGSRVADLVDAFFQQCHSLFKAGLLLPLRPLRVVYMLPHHNITGGMKCLVEQIRLLKKRGHTTIAVHRSDTAKTAMPPWTDLKADVDIVCTLSQRLTDVYPADQIDVVLVGIFHQVAELLAGVPAPVVYWEQGHEWAFGDPIRFNTIQNYLKQDQLFHMCMHLPIPLLSVSSAIQDILLQEFGRHSIIIPNGIDCKKFYPASCQNEGDAGKGTVEEARVQNLNSTKSVIIVGNPALHLKGFDIALAVLSAVSKVLPITVTWICQIKPTVMMLPNLESSNLDINFIIAPPQKDIPELYRGHDLFLFTSRYEAWGMPVLEAMASGLPIITTDCFGVRTFCKHAYNCLMGDPNDLNTLAQYVIRILIDENLRITLGSNARETALKFSPENVVEHLEAALYSLTACSQDLLKASPQSNSNFYYCLLRCFY